MKKVTRIAAFLMAVLMLSACGVTPTETVKEEHPEENAPRVALVPLDDRPNNVECMEYLAQSLGYELLMPDADTYATRLNYQPLNTNGTKYGDRAALYEWISDCEIAGCDRYIIFMDQLLSGGLVNSRAMSGSEPVSLPDGTVMTEKELMQSIIELLGSDKNNRVFLLDTVMRLAPTVDYEQWTLDDYKNVREWASVPRAETDNEPGAIIAGYCTGKDGKEITPADYGVSEDKLNEYLLARQRKMELSSEMLKMLGGYDDVFSVLMGIDDSSEENCIQKNEIKYFESCLRENDALISGVDDMGYKALAKLYLDETGWQGTEADVQYFGGNENLPSSAYDFRPLNEVVEEHFKYFNLRSADDAGLCFIVLTTPADETQKNAYLKSFFSAIDEAFNENKSVVLMDASNGAYGDELRNKLIKNVELGRLISYAGTLDLANLTGVAVSHGVSRYALLQNGDETETTQRGFERCMADVLIKDLCYRTVVRAETTDYVIKAGGNPDNFCNPEISEADMLSYAVDRLDKLTPKLIKNLYSSNMITSLEPYTEAGWGGVELSNYRFPWHRTFELTFDVNVGNVSEVH